MNTVDKVRASRDGHEFHEAWTARKTLQLLFPIDNLIGIAVEGLHPADQKTAASETVEIADITLYYGKSPTFNDADTINITQFKYSVSKKDVDFRASDAKKTIIKFGATYRDHKRRYGAKNVRDKLCFELITNRPIYSELEQAITSIANRKPMTGVVKIQADQFIKACGLNDKSLVEFAGKCNIIGLAGNLTDIKGDLSRTLVDWSATSDPVARARLGDLKAMVRDKAGSAGTNRNVIRHIDVLAVLDVSHVDELLPCRTSLPEVGKIVEREQLSDVLALIPKLDKPLLIDADGGVGKTVFLDSLARILSGEHEVLLFDCFGGGAYRAQEDSRHLPRNGLLHIINTLAFESLCDPILPGNSNEDSLFRTFRKRLSQCVKTLSTASSKRELILFIDAIDNAAQHANDKNESSFPTLLLENLHLIGPVPGVKLVVSCRPYRIDISTKGIPITALEEFKLKPFSLTETENYLISRIPDVTQTEIQVAQARSGGNPRILEHLVTSNRGLLDESEIENRIELDDLLNERIDNALSEALDRGYKEEDRDAFLAGLGVLPPPVPLDEYADAHGIDISAIESFAADLAPLLERTKHGLMFRDEPTETLIRERFASDDKVLRRVADNLLARQDKSTYAASALPGLLQKLDDGESLFELAFSETFPKSITSTVGKRNIRYARLKAAVLHAANESNYNRLVNLLVEISTIAVVDQRGANYILDYPDLVIAAQDVDATRRLFETRTSWQGTRHARLAIAHTLSGDFDEATRHTRSADEWIRHNRQQNRKFRELGSGPEHLDIVAIPFFLISQDRTKNAIGFKREWRHWYAYEVGEYLFSLLEQAKQSTTMSGDNISRFLDSLKDEIGVISSALSFLELENKQRSDLIKKLSKACKRKKKLEKNSNFHRGEKYRIQDGLQKASVIAVSLDLGTEAKAICRHTSQERPNIYSFSDTSIDQQIFPFLLNAALSSAVTGKELSERNILPKELFDISSGMKGAGSCQEFIKRITKHLGSCSRVKKDPSKTDKTISYDQKQALEKFINNRLEPLLTLTKAFSEFLGTPDNKGDNAFLSLMDAWTKARQTHEQYSYQLDRFFQLIGCKITVFALWARSDLKKKSVKIFLDLLQEQEILSPSTVIEVVATLSKRNHLHELAGEQAIKVSSLIEKDDDVDSRATLYAKLGRAILPASIDEATEYFKKGLEQMDAIGSGDYDFTNELLLFASSLKGDELAEQDFHTLTNICELNMSYDESKFPWFAFARGLSKTSGCKGLAKLSRWDDRSKISLNYTLLPYLTALIQDDKIQPEDALALNRLANPVELYGCNTETFVKSVDDKNYPNHTILIRELIQQFEDDNPGVPTYSTAQSLASVAEKSLGKKSEVTNYLHKAYKHFKAVSDAHNENINCHVSSTPQSSRESTKEERQNRTLLTQLVSRTNPDDEVSIGKAIDELSQMRHTYNLKKELLENLRSRVLFSGRSHYIKIISELENLDLYTKLDELKECKGNWQNSSSALAPTYKAVGVQILQLHAYDLISDDRLSGYQIKKIHDLSKVPIADLAIELIKVSASPDYDASGSVWLGLASIICENSDDGEGQSALIRLLNSNSAKLASSVGDGEWKEGFYPADDTVEIASGLVWRMLGSPRASDRWRAAHSIRCFARLKKWNVIDKLVARFSTESAHPFQAPELPFFYMHARLWLLITLARLALDEPKSVAKYGKLLIKVVLDKDSPHVIMRHFASNAILTCVDNGKLKLSARREKVIRAINHSPFTQINPELRTGGANSYYQKRPDEAPEPDLQFSMEYDFNKYEVHTLTDLFGRPGWEVTDMMSKEALSFDKKVTSMHDSGGRESSHNSHIAGMTSKYHSYGYYLGWHSLFIVAGRLLNKFQVTESSYNDDPWNEWLDYKILTRRDGLWLSDGMDRPPLEARINLLEQGSNGLAITGDKSKILSLIGLNSTIWKKVVVKGNWSSYDDINVNISSVLVATRKAKTLARQLIEEKPFLVWLPSYSQDRDDNEYLHSDKHGYNPWIVRPDLEGRLDYGDPLGIICAERRSYFTKEIIKTFSLETDDPFKRTWRNSDGEVVAYSHAWGYMNKYNDEPSSSDEQLVCSHKILKDILTTKNSDLLILVNLQNYEQGGNSGGKYSNTIAVVRIKKTLEFEYYQGAVNNVHQMKY